ncbi:MAG: hypothetical protein LC722_03740 [Actinobacteria bacterium]|nr:hypothetical protein [Actinomycetota bacterium]
MTALAIAGDGAASVMRSPGGRVPVYITERGDAISTRLKWLAPYLPRVAVDPLVVALSLVGAYLPMQSRTPLAGVWMLDRGTATTSGPRPAVRRFWDPRRDRLHPPTEERFRAHAERLRAILIGRLEADLDPGGQNVLSLSGGIDSTALLCLASGALGLPVSALTLSPVTEPHRSREESFIASALSRGPVVEHWREPMTAAAILERSPMVPASGYPAPHPVLAAMPPHIRGGGSRTLFGGEFGDELGGSHPTLTDWVSETSLARLGRVWRAWPAGPQDAIRWIKWRTASRIGRERLIIPDRLGPAFHPDVRAEYLDARADVMRGVHIDPRPLRHLAHRVAVDGFLPMNWEACSELAMVRSFPFYNRAALELLFDCHPAELVGPGYRRLIRAALAGDVPALNLGRRDKGQWGMPPAGPVAWHAEIPAFVRGVLDPKLAPESSRTIDPLTATGISVLARFAASYG